ncbi:hypothetical protein NDI56_04300 [Haloarcula sp. S1CR25-12]|uniref:AI-2E family transporter n=1 Tax=Haloarcula saliterrae TaxID=2950534 RepID=A0ABU2F8N4_9EURY|nr:hypothetical protein [Haloarcula sp. S1CR25-12]MDS0258632.1 hypothetical protein [Haloarcula sp. S1CR25-12]
MVSRENKVIAAYLVATLLVLFVVLETLSPPLWVSSALVLGLGVVAPTLTNEYLDRRAA